MSLFIVIMMIKEENDGVYIINMVGYEADCFIVLYPQTNKYVGLGI